MPERTLVILAAGNGTRMGRVGGELHKALVPLDGKAIISHQIAAAGSYVDHYVVVIGQSKGDQIRDYIELAHPSIDVTYVEKNGGGPGAALLAARKFTDGDVMFTSCDTLWAPFDPMGATSWAATAPVPAGTPEARWCRFVVEDGNITGIMDKLPGVSGIPVYTGLACIVKDDLDTFWTGLENGEPIAGELQVSSGFEAIMEHSTLRARSIGWTDVGDEASYHQAVAQVSGYDWIKSGQATYVLPLETRVVKYHEDPYVIVLRSSRHRYLRPHGGVVAKVDHSLTDHFMGMPWIAGPTGYEYVKTRGANGVKAILDWIPKVFPLIDEEPENVKSIAMEFYRNKTFKRIEQLPRGIRSYALDMVSRVNWDALCSGVRPSAFHGDMNFGNIIYNHVEEKLYGIDWREDFAEMPWGDQRYDYGKLVAGCVVHWDNARRGDFRPWLLGPLYKDQILERFTEYQRRDIEIIGALSLLNCAPLHASPLDEILVVRGCNWLGDLL